MDKGTCNMCSEFDYVEHHNLYVSGSEGVWLCKKCEILLCEVIRSKQRLIIKNKIASIKMEEKKLSEPKENPEFLSDVPLVLKSAAGYYIGTVTEQGFPLDRFSGYFASRDEAHKELPLYSKKENQVSYFLSYSSFPGDNL